jgi:hypothetical protein
MKKEYSSYLGQMSYECSHCSALFFKDELNADGLITRCCKGGRITLPMMDLPPPYLHKILNKTDEKHKLFYDNATQLNNLLSFATVYMRNDSLAGIPSIRVNGTVFSTIRPGILSDFDTSESYDYQSYFHNYDDDLELKDDAKDLLYKLEGYFKHHNHYHKCINSIFSSYGSMLDKIPIFSIRFSDTIQGFHRGTTNAPSIASKIGLIFHLPEDEKVGHIGKFY